MIVTALGRAWANIYENQKEIRRLTLSRFTIAFQKLLIFIYIQRRPILRIQS